jgi:hypothetical protein
MAVVSTLIFGDKRVFKLGGTITFDLLLSESHNFTNEVTEHFVEDGSTISDHIKNNLENGIINAVITNYSIREFGSTAKRDVSVFEALKELWKKRELTTLVTNLQVYDNIALTDVSVDKTPDTGESSNITISFKQVKIVKLQTVEIKTTIKTKNTKTNKRRQASTKKDEGFQPVDFFGDQERLPNNFAATDIPVNEALQ